MTSPNSTTNSTHARAHTHTHTHTHTYNKVTEKWFKPGVWKAGNSRISSLIPALAALLANEVDIYQPDSASSVEPDWSSSKMTWF